MRFSFRAIGNVFLHPVSNFQRSRRRSSTVLKASGKHQKRVEMDREGFKVLSEEVAYSRYLTVKDRSIQFPEKQANKVHSFANI